MSLYKRVALLLIKRQKFVLQIFVKIGKGTKITSGGCFIVFTTLFSKINAGLSLKTYFLFVLCRKKLTLACQEFSKLSISYLFSSNNSVCQNVKRKTKSNKAKRQKTLKNTQKCSFVLTGDKEKGDKILTLSNSNPT